MGAVTFHFKGREFHLSATTGTVFEQERRTETQTYSTGGGGFAYGNIGYVEAPRVKTQIKNTSIFWLRTSDGVEEWFGYTRLSDAKVPDFMVANGQHVSAVYATESNPLPRSILCYYNHTTRQLWTPDSRYLAVHSLKLVKRPGKIGVIILLVGLFLFPIGTVASISYIAWYTLKRIAATKELEKWLPQVDAYARSL